MVSMGFTGESRLLTEGSVMKKSIAGEGFEPAASGFSYS